MANPKRRPKLTPEEKRQIEFRLSFYKMEHVPTPQQHIVRQALTKLLNQKNALIKVGIINPDGSIRVSRGRKD